MGFMTLSRIAMAMALVVAIWTGTLLHAARAEQAAGGGTTWSGVYTEEQAKSGAAVYAKACAECHLEDLAGDGFAPALKGPEFMNNWNALTVGDLFERIRISMPPSNPNSVTAKEKSEIVAHILKNAGFPAGSTPLASQTDALKSIKFEATKPGIR
jgi:mono/diheme cytochrome c family protein